MINTLTFLRQSLQDSCVSVEFSQFVYQLRSLRRRRLNTCIVLGFVRTKVNSTVFSNARFSSSAAQANASMTNRWLHPTVDCASRDQD